MENLSHRKVVAGQFYRHFKGHVVKVLSIAQDTEHVGQFYVVYECDNGDTWCRPYEMFISEVDHEKYPDVKQKYRFEYLWEKGKNKMPELDLLLLKDDSKTLLARKFEDSKQMMVKITNGLVKTNNSIKLLHANDELSDEERIDLLKKQFANIKDDCLSYMQAFIDISLLDGDCKLEIEEQLDLYEKMCLELYTQKCYLVTASI